jgi:hypothetical protein
MNFSITKKFELQNGQAALAAVLAGLFISFSIGIGISAVAFLNIQRIQSNTQRAQSYYAAEGALEDALLRTVGGQLSYQTGVSQTIAVGSSTASTTITYSDNTLVIQSDGSRQNAKRKLRVLLTPAPGGTSFSYGAQIGDGGVRMDNNSIINGNLYSNGSVIVSGTNAEVRGDVFVAGASNKKIDGARITVDAHANRIEDSFIDGDAYYQTIFNTSVSGNLYPGSEDPEPGEMPIAQSQIDEWKSTAAAGGTIAGDYNLAGNNAASLGPRKINGNLNIQNTAVLTMTGTIWVTGNVSLKNSGAIQLASSYGNKSGVMVVDGVVTIENSFVLCGSEGFNGSTCNPTGNSYFLMLSTNTGDPAINMKGTANLNGVLYAANGTLAMENNGRIKGGAAYRLHLKNNAVITFETGLINLYFTQGPGGLWVIQSWEEVN